MYRYAFAEAAHEIDLVAEDAGKIIIAFQMEVYCARSKKLSAACVAG
jgi:hypothetical protein